MEVSTKKIIVETLMDLLVIQARSVLKKIQNTFEFKMKTTFELNTILTSTLDSNEYTIDETDDAATIGMQQTRITIKAGTESANQYFILKDFLKTEKNLVAELNEIKIGSMFKITNNTNKETIYFVLPKSIQVKKIPTFTADTIDIFCIPENNPLSKVVLGKRINDSFIFKNTTYTINKII